MSVVDEDDEVVEEEEQDHPSDLGTIEATSHFEEEMEEALPLHA